MRNRLPVSLPITVPDPRPSRAHPEHRAARKAFEKEHPHFNMTEFGMKAGALALFAAVALFPWEKEYEKHERTHHPERFEDSKKSGGKDERRGSRDDRDRGNERDSRRDRRDGDADRRRRRQSEGGDREREYRRYLDRDREYRDVAVIEGGTGGWIGGERGVEGGRYTGDDDGEYGRKYVEASQAMERNRERAREMDRRSGRRRGESVDYEYVDPRNDRRRSDR